MPYTCDQHSVGVLVTRPRGTAETEYLVITRVTAPTGVAPVAGHVFDSHLGPAAAARAEVAEETGLAVTALALVAEGWRPNRCGARRSRAASGPAGHYWWIYQAAAEGAIDLAPDEVHTARWVTRADLQELAKSTARYAHRFLGEDAWRERPGLEPVWCDWLARLGLIDLSDLDHSLIDRIAAAELPTVLDGWLSREEGVLPAKET